MRREGPRYEGGVPPFHPCQDYVLVRKCDLGNVLKKTASRSSLLLPIGCQWVGGTGVTLDIPWSVRRHESFVGGLHFRFDQNKLQ